MIKLEILHPLLMHVKENETSGGISSYRLAEKMGMQEQRVRYYLKLVEKDGFIEKEGAKFKTTSEVFVQNGFAILWDKNNRQFSFVGCRHYGQTCQCSGIITDDCLLLREKQNLALVKRFLKEKQKKKKHKALK